MGDSDHNERHVALDPAFFGGETLHVAPAPCGTNPSYYAEHLHVPLRGPDGRLVIVTGDRSARCHAWLKAQYGDTARIIDVPARPLLAEIERIFRDDFIRRAVSELAECEPQFSARQTMTRQQAICFGGLLIATGSFFWLAPAAAAIAFTVLCGSVFCVNAIFRAALLWIGAEEPKEPHSSAPRIPDSELPVYSILVPLYREANVIPALARALRAIDYPAEKIDIKLIVEADDAATIVAAENAAIDPRFTVIRVPPGAPRTKPRACNYALPFVRGAFTVIFDAEDRPEPDQLRKAVEDFRQAPAEVACLQARLNFYNAKENWLTKMFALDYALWFDYLLPGLDRLNIPMPLGGTSNHFRTEVLRAIHGWDPYNVTEDADLGIRLARVGCRVRTFDSTTFEEATNDFGNWLRQRSRWLKGYMQTWLVHMRSPRMLLRNAGLGGFVGFQLFIGGTFLSALVSPFLWAIFVLSNIFGLSLFHAPLVGVMAHISVLCLLTGNGLFAYLAMLAPFRRGWLELSPYGLTAPVYWLLVSLAGARAVWQLFSNPWHWEKTAHGLSKMGSSK